MVRASAVLLALLLLACSALWEIAQSRDFEAELRACGARVKDQLILSRTVKLPRPNATPSFRSADCLGPDDVYDNGTLILDQFKDAGGVLSEPGWWIESADYEVVWNCGGCGLKGFLPILYSKDWVKFAVKCDGLDPRHPTLDYRIVARLVNEMNYQARLEQIGRYCSAVVLHPGVPLPE